jgi:chaperone modulatory protein CbpM
MMRLEAVLAHFPELEPIELSAWIERSWVRPDPDGQGGWIFREIDVARVRLIYELRIDLAIADDALPLVVSLLDQLYETRHQLRQMVTALGSQPAPVRDAVLQLIGGVS